MDVFLFKLRKRVLGRCFKETGFALVGGFTSDGWLLFVFFLLLLLLPPLMHKVVLTVYLNFEGELDVKLGKDRYDLDFTFEIVPEVFPDFFKVSFLFFFVVNSVQVVLRLFKFLNVVLERILDIERNAFDVLFFIVGGKSIKWPVVSELFLVGDSKTFDMTWVEAKLPTWRSDRFIDFSDDLGPLIKERCTFLDIDVERSVGRFGTGERKGENMKLELINRFGKRRLLVLFHVYLIWLNLYASL